MYSPHGILSRSERYLYYSRRTSICPNGGDTSVCDEWSIGIIDLTAGEQIAQAKVGLGCAPQFEGDSQFEDTVLVTCGKVAATSVQSTPDVVRLFRVSPDGETSELGTFSRRTTNWASSVLFAGPREDGTYFAVYNDGAVLDGGGEEVVADLLPEENGEFGFNTGASLGSEGYVLAFRTRFEHTFSGVMVLNATAPESFRTFDLPFPFEHLAPIDERRVALLHGAGFQVSVLDIETGRVSDAMTLPERVEWLSGG